MSNHPEAEAGLDVKYAVTQGLVADLTVNTDFAQVEADEQQINLTRFSLFFPEKRDFFLENQGTFAFGGVAVNSVGGNFGGGFIGGSSAAPILFYSRRIGLHEGRQVPLNVGGTVTGRAGRYSVGVLNIQTGEEERTSAHRPPTSAWFASSATCCGAAASACCSRIGRSRRSAPAAIARMASTARSRSSRTCRSTPTGRGPTPTA